MKLERTKVDIDFFGVAGNSLITALQSQSSNNRARKLAFNGILKLAKACKLIPFSARPVFIALEVNRAGILQLTFTCEEAASANVAGRASPLPKTEPLNEY